MDLVGELVIARSALERRLGEIDRLGEVLFASRARLGQAVADIERRSLEARLPSRRGRGAAEDEHARPRSVAELFAELEFDRYDDLTLFARSVSEIASDIAEVHTELASLGRSVREDVGLVHRLTGEVRAGLGRARLVPIGSLYTRFARQGQEAARAASKSVRIETSGESVELDASVIEQIVDPLLHLAQNAVAHGIENPEERQAAGKPAAGVVSLTASHRGAFVVVEVADDGRGIDVDRLRQRAVAQGFVTAEVAAALSDKDALELIFRPGFSTAAEVTTTAGRGVGMDIVRTNVGRLNGEVEVSTELGVGTRFSLRLPLDRAGHRGAARARGRRGAGGAGQRGARDRDARSERATHHRGRRGGADRGSLAPDGPSRSRARAARAGVGHAAAGARPARRRWPLRVCRATRSSTRRRSSSSRWARFSTAWGRTRGRRSRPTGG